MCRTSGGWRTVLEDDRAPHTRSQHRASVADRGTGLKNAVARDQRATSRQEDGAPLKVVAAREGDAVKSERCILDLNVPGPAARVENAVARLGGVALDRDVMSDLERSIAEAD